MLSITYKAANFNNALATLNGESVLKTTWAQLVWAAVTVGKAAGDEFAYGRYSRFERINRAALLRAYLVEDDNGNLQRSAAFATLDPSEKGGVSYAFGMTLAKLFAGKKLNTPRLLHFAVYSKNYKVATAKGKSRPDLIGLTRDGDWIVFEAKGRSNGIENEALAAAKQQARQIAN